ncbi:MAG: sulfotransferase family protein [Pseudomonadota bacterium]
MAFPGVWMNESETLIYRVVPKCGCSTIGQALFYCDHGRFFDGDIHDAGQGLHKWAREDSQPRIVEKARSGATLTFTCVRNPYTRILSCFLDKICGMQRNGQRYRGNLLAPILARYGIEVEGTFDQIAMFRRFLLFVRDTIRFRKPMDPDIHWSACAGHVSTLIAGGGRYDRIFATEDLVAGLQGVLDIVKTPHRLAVDSMPRFNESQGHGPKRAHPVEAYFDDLSIHLMHEIYRRDFNLFNYDRAPGRAGPKGEIDLDRLHARFND